MSEQFDDASNVDDLDSGSFAESYIGDDLSMSQSGDNDEIDENDEEDSSMLADRLKTGQNDYVISVEKTYSNYYNNDKITMPYMTKFEKAKLLGVRAEMIASGDKPMVEIVGKVSNAYEIAVMELKQKKIPLIIRRTLPNGKIEDWRVEELIIKHT
ncbi:DNA-directed RNA polymerase subunit omega [bacterium]|nr:DNA-directed RNA polymerase subunit omega [bacterium]